MLRKQARKQKYYPNQSIFTHYFAYNPIIILEVENVFDSYSSRVNLSLSLYPFKLPIYLGWTSGKLL